MATPVYKKISELPIGSQIIFGKNRFQGKYQDGEEDIVWLVVSKDHHTKDSGYPVDAVTMMTKDVIRYMSFDAKEPTNTLTDRQISGNNRWKTSNIRQWLNSQGYANQWFVPQNLGTNGVDNKDTPPSAEYMMNVVRNYPYVGDNGFMRSFTDSELSAMKYATITTMIPTVSAGGEGGGRPETTTDRVFLPSKTEITGQQNGTKFLGAGLLDEGKLFFNNDQDRLMRKARATQLGLINGANYSLNQNTDKVYFFRSPSNSGNDINRFADGGTTGSASSVKPFSNDGIRPVTNIDVNAIVIMEGQGIYRFVDNAKPYVTFDGSNSYDIDLSIYDYDNTLYSAVIQLNNEQIDSFSVSGKKSVSLTYKLPYDKLFTGNNTVKIIVTDEKGSVGTKTLNIKVEKNNVPVTGDTIFTQDGDIKVNETVINSKGELELILEKNLIAFVKKTDIVEKVDNTFTPLIAINDDYNSLPIYQNMKLKSIEFDKKKKTAIEEWELVGMGKYTHTKIKMIRKDVYSSQYLSKVSQIFTYYDED